MGSRLGDWRDYPKDVSENLRFRRALRQKVVGDPRLQRGLMGLCRDNPLFWLNVFGWTADPRKVDQKRGMPVSVPFVTYPFQDESFTMLCENLGFRDMLIEKSRDMGASWLCLLAIGHGFLFTPLSSFLLVSRTEDLVDKRADPDSLFWKLDFMFEHLPAWMQPQMNRSSLSCENLSNRSTILGSSTTGETSRGGRKTAILFDEFASVPDGYAMDAASQSATNCRIFNSTPKGSGNAFYDQAQKSSILKVRMHWSQHPVKNVGLYYDENGKARSPWYDREAERFSHPQLIAQELDIDYLGSDFQYFPESMVQRCLRESASPAAWVGVFDVDGDGKVKELREESGGTLQLWNVAGVGGSWPKDDRFVIGCDIAQGTGATPSSAAVVRLSDGEQVAEFTTPHLRPEQFADRVMALGRWFNDAKLIHEANGPGRGFGSRVIEAGYLNIFWRETNEGAAFTRKATEFPGWWSSGGERGTKNPLMDQLRVSLTELSIVVRSRPALEELRSYVYTKDQSIEHKASRTSVDLSEARNNHADRVIAIALCNKELQRYRRDRASVKEEPVLTWGSIKSRRDARKREESLALNGTYWGKVD